MKKLTDNEIIERLEALVKNGFPFCADALNLINHLKELDKKNENIIRLVNKTIESQSAEMERLTKEIEVKDSIYQRNTGLREKRIFDLMDELKTAKSEAIKEFAERLKEKAPNITEERFHILRNEIDNLVKEMVGDDNA